ncbi:ankyrin repeat domain-containing protein [Nocardia sp. NPDC049707]|uniref:ankyrin repeat domain-containing protein n=1 Tax=Nocardia sp. NPDC049707 TaxID=3154735 RepID=UPI0034483186
MHTLRRHSVLTAAALAALSVGVAACTADPPRTRQSTTVATTVADAPGSVPTPTAVDPAMNGQLLQAAANDDEGRVRELIASGADIETRGDRGRTPLVVATKNRATAAARVLIDAGADVNAKDDLEDSAYLYAGAEGLDDILEMTLRHGADLRSVNRYGGTALIPASEHGHVSTVRRLIEAGVDVNHVNKPRWTALHEAIVYGDGSPRYQQTVTALLQAGADPSIRDGSGRTALDNAERRSQSVIAMILRDHLNRGTR